MRHSVDLCMSPIVVFSRLCFLNATATTESYTYWHTLSLPDALPICTPLAAAPRPRPQNQIPAIFLVHHAEHSCALDLRFRAIGADRSEEHTSELQSLMRISYAVFCLNKNYHNDQSMPSNLHTASAPLYTPVDNLPI